MNTHTTQLYFIISYIIYSVFASTTAFAQDNYTSSELFTIPWGNDISCMSGKWMHQQDENEYNEGDITFWTSQPWIVTPLGYLVIADNGLMKVFNSNGTLFSSSSYDSLGFSFIPDAIASSIYDSILLTSRNRIYLVNKDLTVLNYHEFDQNVLVTSLFPSIQGGFYIIYHPNYLATETYKTYYSQQGLLSPSLLLYKRTEFGCDPCLPSSFVDPYGYTYQSFTDSFGFVYETTVWPNHALIKRHIGNELTVYTKIISSDEGFTDFEKYSISPNFYITYSGDFYTLHATSEGAVLTKYTLQINSPPVCHADITTFMPYYGSLPASITFDASASYDPDPIDTLTYEWDFDGDGIFSEPVDDAYTGDPVTPTHIYASEYQGIAMVKVTDSHDASCTYAVWVHLIEEQLHLITLFSFVYNCPDDNPVKMPRLCHGTRIPTGASVKSRAMSRV